MNLDQNGIGKLNKLQSINIQATSDLDSGTIDSATLNSITCTGKAWTVNQFKDKVVRISVTSVEIYYSIVLSNTANTLTLDDNNVVMPSGTFRIIPTLLGVVNTIHAIDITTNDIAVILPSSSTYIERQLIHVYNELSNNNLFRCVVICRNSQRVRGKKFLTLDAKFEGVKLYAHTWGINHWDLVQIDNVKRYLYAYRTIAETIPVGGFGIVTTTGNFTLGDARRFLPYDKSGKTWFKNTSIIENTFQIIGVFNLTKSGGGFSNVELAIRVFDYSTGLTTDYSNVSAIIKFSVAESKQGIFSIPIKLDYLDEVTMIAKTDVGVVTINTGSGIVISEL